MDRWAGKVAIVTGASAGIGAAVAKTLVKHGVIVVGAARRLEKLQELTATLGKDKFYPVQCDVMKEEDILAVFKWVEKHLGGADILVNNAGAATNASIIDGPTSEYRKVIDVNLMAPAIAAREIAQSIKKRNVNGHIININSIAGQFAEAIPIPLGMYCPSKYALRALGIELRHEFIANKLRIKVTNISPGAVDTEMLRSVVNESKVPALRDQHIADAVISALGMSEGAEIHEITILPQNTSVVFAKPSKE